MAALAKNPAERPKDAFSFATVLRNLKRSRQQMTQRSEPTVRGLSTARGVDASAPSPEAPLDVRNPSPSRVDVLSPVTPHRAPTRLPRTTIVGMSRPTLGATTGAPWSAIETPSDAVDRLAPTRSIVPDAMRPPGLRTDVLTPSHVSLPDPFAPADKPEDIPEPSASAGAVHEWALERESLRSEGPQVRSLGPPAPSPPPWRAIAAVTLGVSGLVALGLIAFPGRRHPQSTGAVPPRGSATPAMPSASPGFTVLAPTIALPALDEPAQNDPPIRGRPASELAISTSTAIGPSGRPSAPEPRPAPGGHATGWKAWGAVVDRPGPGF
jgi:hypothetical protein